MGFVQFLLTSPFVAATGATDHPAWAYPVNPPGITAKADDGRILHVPDSGVGFTRSQITAIGGTVPDWHPNEHPPMPSIVAQSREPKVYACGYCHLPTGAGRPENAGLAGLSAPYIKQQMEAFRKGDRPGSSPDRMPQNAMIAIAQSVTEAEIDAAAAYIASLKPQSFVRVVESATVPKTHVAGWTLTRSPEGGSEPIGRRIVEIPEDFERFELRDSRTPYKAFVPPGSLARGAHLVTTGGAGKTLQCLTCHGPELKGLVDVPRLVGRSPSYLLRQLYDLKHGARKGGATELMKPVVAQLELEDMVDIAAYLASLQP